MRITLLPIDIAWNDPLENIKRAESMMDETPSADLYVLPEMWATGFAVNPFGIAEKEETSDALKWMRETATEKQVAVCGSLAIQLSEQTYVNRHYFVTPNSISFYDKRHLFTHGHEDTYFTAGKQAVIAKWKGFRFLLQTCYDLRFPVFSRYGRAGEYDAIIYVANWPQQRQSAWDTLLRARAIENQSYVIGVNRVGVDPVCAYNGGSVIIDPIGRLLSAQSADISIDKLREMRLRFRVLDDRDLIDSISDNNSDQH